MFVIEYCQLTEMPDVFKVPKKVPEEKVPVPVQKKEAPLAKGTSSLKTWTSFSSFSIKNFMFYVSGSRLLLMSFVYESLLLIVLNVKNYIFKVPEVQKKIPEKKIPEKRVPVPKKEAVPPAKGIFGKFLDFYVLHESLWVVFILYFEYLHFFCIEK